MISIIVPVYNIAEVVSYCIESVIRQSVDTWELILVDDGSTDNSLEILKRYSRENKRINVVSKTNGGLSSARNLGIEHAFGEWIMFVDGDDYLADNTIKILSDLSAKENVDVIQYGYNEVSDYSNRVNCPNPESCSYGSSLEKRFENLYTIGGEAASACTKLFKRDIFDKLKFKEGIIHEDEEFTTRLLFEVNNILYVDIKPYQYVKRDNSIITSRFNYKKLDLIDIMNDRIRLLQLSGLDQIAEKFFWKYINNLELMYQRAKTSGDSLSRKKIGNEIKFHLNRVENYPSNLSLIKKIRYQLLSYSLYPINIEVFLRTMTGHSL
ncbi:MAG: glycosyltransferase [Bacteroides sp.]|nr:glycosyltransferase [Bacteroides sp.]